ncbi:MAG: twin-arginine translocase TatA/TatE family subunit [Gemmatimonadales bacterium]|nr:MAG: twin-arginine translocase TatA/TatE family subunit [Gemmatimonadales bacterium]
MFGGIGVWEVLVVGLIVILLFGARRIPEVARSLGTGIRSFKGGLEGRDQLEDGDGQSPGDDHDRKH